MFKTALSISSYGSNLAIWVLQTSPKVRPKKNGNLQKNSKDPPNLAGQYPQTFGLSFFNLAFRQI